MTPFKNFKTVSVLHVFTNQLVHNVLCSELGSKHFIFMGRGVEGK
jgi:hypothetical protein